MKGLGHWFSVSSAPVLLLLVENTFGLFVSPFLALVVSAVVHPVLMVVVVFVAQQVSTLGCVS